MEVKSIQINSSSQVNEYKEKMIIKYYKKIIIKNSKILIPDKLSEVDKLDLPIMNKLAYLERELEIYCYHDIDINKLNEELEDIDKIEKNTDNREDFINLGYDSAIMTINGHISYKTSLLLHHLQKKITDPVHKESFNPKDYHTYLANYHSFDAINPKDYYTSLIGGSHMNGIYNTFILAPSFLNDRKYNGAMHLKIFLNANKEIENIIVINLINN